MLDFVIAPLLLAAFTALTIAVLRACWAADVRRHGDDKLVTLTFYVAIGHVFIFMGLPAIFRFALNWSTDRAFQVSPSEIVHVYFIELVSFAAWCIAFTAVRALLSQPRALVPSTETRRSHTASIFLFLMLALGAIRSAEMLFSRAELAAGGGVIGATSLVSDRFFWPLLPATTLAGSVVGCYVLARGRKYFGTPLWASAVAGLGLYLAAFGLAGVRGTLVWPVLWSALIVRLYRPALWKPVAVIAVLGTLGLGTFQSTYLALRSTASEGTVSERIATLQDAPRESANLAEAIESRIGATSRYSVGFVRMWERGRRAYWAPIANSAWAPVPRLFYPDKPWPTSADGDQYSSGMYLCVGEIHRRENYTMTEFLTGSHAYWEFGWAGVIGLSAVAGAFIASCIRFTGRMSGAAAPALLLFFKPWGYNNPKLWVSDIVLELVQIVPALLALWFAARAFGHLFGTSRRKRSLDLPSVGAQ